MTDRHQARKRFIVDASHEFRWVNSSEETVPAFGVVKLSAWTAAKRYFGVIKPDGEDGLYYTNGPVDTLTGKHGQSNHWRTPQLCLISGSPSVGDEVGPTDGSWAMSSSGSGYRVFIPPTGGVGAVLPIGSGGGSGSRIKFEIIDAFCPDDYTNVVTIDVQWTHHNIDCSEPPGVDPYTGLIKVYDSCILSFFNIDDLPGLEGSATYFYPRETCEPLWIIDHICGQPECGQ